MCAHGEREFGGRGGTASDSWFGLLKHAKPNCVAARTSIESLGVPKLFQSLLICQPA